MSRVAKKGFFGVHAPDSPACVQVDTETNTSLLILDLESCVLLKCLRGETGAISITVQCLPY